MSLINQVLTGISGLILPVYIIQTYSSEANGLVASITQFLSIIAFLDFGVGAVVQSNLYKPLSDNDSITISKILISAEKFYKKIAYLFLAYTFILAILFPFLGAIKYGFVYTASMVLILSIGNFAQYYFGITYQTLLGADQRSYVFLFLQNIAVVLNLILCIAFINLGYSLHFVRFITMAVYLIKPIGINWYVKKHYLLYKDLEISDEPIKQKWNGLYQHIAAVVLKSNAVLILTLFSTLANVSIYTVYNNVMRMLEQIIEAASSGIQALIGNMYAKREYENLFVFFSITEWLIHSCVTISFTMAGILIIPFVKIYTRNITDINYIYHDFSVVLSVACAVYCIRIPYYILIKAAGHYKETQSSAIIEIILNIVASTVGVIWYGLIGVAYGSLLAMLYRTTYLAYYALKNIMHIGMKSYFNNIIKDIVIISGLVYVSRFICITELNYFQWIKAAILLGLMAILDWMLVSVIFSKSEIKLLFSRFGKSL